MIKKLLSLRKNKFTLQFYSLSLLGQNIVWTNSTSGKKKHNRKNSGSDSKRKNLTKTLIAAKTITFFNKP